MVVLEIGGCLECGDVYPDFRKYVESDTCRPVPQIARVSRTASKCEWAESVFGAIVEIKTVEAFAELGHGGPAIAGVFHVSVESNGKRCSNGCAGQCQRRGAKTAAVEKVLQGVTAAGHSGPVNTVADSVKANSYVPGAFDYSGGNVEREPMPLPRGRPIDC